MESWVYGVVHPPSFSMKKVKQPIIKYVYIEPKTQQEKIEQERIMDSIFDDIFRQAIRQLKEKNGHKESKKNTR